MSTAVSQLPLQAARVEGEIQRIFDKQRETALRWRTSTAEERLGRIKRLRDAVLANLPALYEAAYKDFRKPAAEVDLTEIVPIMSDVSEYTHTLRRWMKPKKVWPTRLTMGLAGWVQYEPRGRCLIVAPWNYPVNLSFCPLIAALAAGNTAFIKPSEMTPHTSAWMVKIVKDVFPEDEVAIFEGDASVSTALLALPFDHIFFTGSPAIGKVVMAAAAKHLTSVTLELGGKSPTIVDETADLDLAAATLMWGKYVNSGQTCIAPDHVYVHESVKDAFVQKSVAVLKQRYGATPEAQMQSPDLAHIVNERHTKRVGGLLADAKAKGARVLCGDLVDEKERFVAPTLLENCPPSAKIMEEEIFGPLLPVIPYRDLGQVIRTINDAPKPLALYVWSRNQANIDKVMMNVSAGGACINHCLTHFSHGNLPFGGVNNSGIGNYHGFWGFRAFSHEKAVVRTRFMAARMFFPPYTPKVRRSMQIIIKLFKWF
ncbi:MAG: aldehyde dehydrogenase family protein [Gammaproteobacteria bacterium]|nr:aldehyde dehydrogenase family protein [Gammaproteobacteria bacterium]